MELDLVQAGQNFASLNSAATDVKRNPVGAKSEQEDGSIRIVSESEKTAKANFSGADIDEASAKASLNSAVEEISDFVNSNGRALNFSIDENTKQPVVKVTDAASGEVIRQIPSEEVLKLSERIQSLQDDVGAAVGVLFSRQV